MASLSHTGTIADQVRQLMPVTWDALAADARVGATALGYRIDYTKYRLFSTVVDSVAESTLYSPLVTDYVAKYSALQIIPAAIEYWMEQQASISTTGTQESVSYPDRIAALERTFEWLTKEVAVLRPEMEGQFAVRRKSNNYPSVANDADLRTPSPLKWPRQTDIGGFDLGNSTLPFLPWGPSF